MKSHMLKVESKPTFASSFLSPSIFRGALTMRRRNSITIKRANFLRYGYSEYVFSQNMVVLLNRSGILALLGKILPNWIHAKRPIYACFPPTFFQYNITYSIWTYTRGQKSIHLISKALQWLASWTKVWVQHWYSYILLCWGPFLYTPWHKVG